MNNFFAEPLFIFQLVAVALMGAAGGMLGSFALLRRMALVGDALSHVALPGLALALLFHFNPLIGALAFLLFGTTVIWAIEHRTRIPVDTLVGVLFVVALAIGTLLTPDVELLEALFGDITDVSLAQIVWGASLSLLIIALLLFLKSKITLSLLSADLAQTARLRPHLLEFLFLTLFALITSVGIQFAGVLLTGSLIIIPAAISRNLTGSMKTYVFLSALLGGAGTVAGVIIATATGLAPGPTFILLLGSIFFVSLLFKKNTA
ncbi:MAG: metal ABC transporter permease [Parcubacteria group bacterium]|nr:metal ABC transporter permease [Parcubacteria group bacterium]